MPFDASPKAGACELERLGHASRDRSIMTTPIRKLPFGDRWRRRQMLGSHPTTADESGGSAGLGLGHGCLRRRPCQGYGRCTKRTQPPNSRPN